MRLVVGLGIGAALLLAFASLFTHSTQTTAVLGFAGVVVVQLVNLYKTDRTQQQTNGILERRLSALERAVEAIRERLGIGEG